MRRSDFHTLPDREPNEPPRLRRKLDLKQAKDEAGHAVGHRLLIPHTRYGNEFWYAGGDSNP